MSEKEIKIEKHKIHVAILGDDGEMIIFKMKMVCYFLNRNKLIVLRTVDL